MSAGPAIVSGLGAALESSEACRSLWDGLPLHEFVRLDNTRTFGREHPLVVYKTHHLVGGIAAGEVPVGPLAFTRLDLITCGGVPVGYVITAPRCRVRVRPAYAVLSITGGAISDSSSLFQDDTLGVLGDREAVVAFGRNVGK